MSRSTWPQTQQRKLPAFCFRSRKQSLRRTKSHSHSNNYHPTNRPTNSDFSLAFHHPQMSDSQQNLSSSSDAPSTTSAAPGSFESESQTCEELVTTGEKLSEAAATLLDEILQAVASVRRSFAESFSPPQTFHSESIAFLDSVKLILEDISASTAVNRTVRPVHPVKDGTQHPGTGDWTPKGRTEAVRPLLGRTEFGTDLTSTLNGLAGLGYPNKEGLRMNI